jgi:hypothetical protein
VVYFARNIHLKRKRSKTGTKHSLIFREGKKHQKHSQAMRKKFEQQYSIDLIPISEVKIKENKRDELPPILLALQHIFVTPELNQEVFKIMEEAILKGKKKTGRTGMDLWHILVLGVVRMGLELNYDRLCDISNHHTLIRKIMGINPVCEETKKFALSTIRDNASLLDESVIEQIDKVVVKAGHQLVKKKDEKLSIKADTYVLETNVHFPTDISLLWDSARKCLDIITELREAYPVKGWRKFKFWYKDIKKQCRILSKTCQSGGKNKERQVKKQATEYLRLAKELNEKIIQSKEQFYKLVNSPMSLAQLLSLDYYHNMLCKHINLVERRLIKGEVIPQYEKLYSIFETHTEWKKKGKSNNKVELGHNILIASDQFNFIVYHKVIFNQQDVELAIPLAGKLNMLFGENAIDSISLDKGFWKPENKLLLQTHFPNVIMPKKGKKNKAEQEEESSKVFKKLRNKHSAVESNINSLEHHGLNRCPDKGKKGFVKYTALGVLSYNLHRLGLIAMDKQAEKISPIRKAA